jgi:hypothetical protein
MQWLSTFLCPSAQPVQRTGKCQFYAIFRIGKWILVPTAQPVDHLVGQFYKLGCLDPEARDTGTVHVAYKWNDFCDSATRRRPHFIQDRLNQFRLDLH